MNPNPDIKAYYDELAPQYQESRFANTYGQYIQAQEMAVLEKYLSQNPSEPCLDLACGSGRYLNFASHGMDISPEMLKVARAKHPKIDFQLGDARALNYADGSFGNCLSFHLFMHLERESLKQILSEVHRILVPGGRFLFDIPSAERRKLTNYQSESWHGAYSISPRELQSLLGPGWELENYFGIASFPIHRIPKKLRSGFRRIDNFLGRSPVKNYASHLLFILRKKP